MATLVCFHAHPDDEVLNTGGLIARSSDSGHRVVLVTATRGEHGEIAPGVLSEGEALAARREQEVAASAEILGVARHEFLGYVDSGMMGTPPNEAPASFWQADVEEAAGRLAAILTEEGADALTIYDDNGGYGHPDHIQVHRVGVRAAEIAGVRAVYQATMDQGRMRAGLERTATDERLPADSPMKAMAREMLASEFTFGVPGELITNRVDVAPWISRKRQALVAHATQIAPESFFLVMPEWAFTEAFGEEAFICLHPDEPDPEIFAGTRA
ncbi:MAG: PIG-L family deacetylase [Acidimicrobiales bacterium]